MKPPSLTLAAAFAAVALVSPATISAAKCTADQVRTLYSQDLSTLFDACPSIFVDDAAIDGTDIDTITNEALEAMSSCQASECLSELSASIEIVPDCSDQGTNYNKMYIAFLEICEGFSAGDVTVFEAREILRSAASSGTTEDDGSRSNGGEIGGEADSSTATPTATATTQEPTTEATPAATTSDTSVAVTPSPPTSAPTPAPTSTPKSGASATKIGRVAVVTAVSLVASLLL